MAGGGVAGGGGGAFLDALDKSQSKRDGGFKNNWSFDHSEESEGDAEKDEASLLSIDESDGTSSPSSEKKSLHYRSGTIGSRYDSLRTYTRRSKVETSRVIRGNSIGLNMLTNNKKLSENVHNISRPGTLLHGRRFHHTHVQTPLIKTAAQSNLDQKERKEYPPNIQKIENDCIRFSRLQEMQIVTDNREGSGSESDSGVMRKVQLKRHCNLYQSGLLQTPATKKCAAHLEFKGVEQSHYTTVCPCNVKADESQTKCQICGSLYLGGLQRQSMQSVKLNDSLGPLARESIHETPSGQKSLTQGLNTKKFYGSPPGTVSVDFMVRRDAEPVMMRPNGKVCSKITGKMRQKSPTASELNDPIVLSSDDEEEEEEIGSSNRMESISPRPADSACSSPAPSTGKVEAALKENTCGIEQRLTSITADTEPAVILPRKARMKDQFEHLCKNWINKDKNAP